jgi:Rps23 Pro-64 3,4-dihydroxylase Tpa1-like proline 4-hydroxylase
MDTLDNFIQVFNDILPPDVCDRVVNEYSSTDEWEDARIENYRLDKNYRRVSLIPISAPQIIANNKEVRTALDADIFQGAAKVIAKYNQLVVCDVKRDTGYDLLRYQTGGFYKVHTDSATDTMRTLSCSFILNDDYEGGKFFLLQSENNKQYIETTAGSVIVFPSHIMHGVEPVTAGVRKSLATWIIGPNFK